MRDRSPWLRWLVGWAIVGFGSAVPLAAVASPWDLYGFNPRALAMGGAHTAFADDFTAVYYNPAALTAASDVCFGLGFVASHPSLSLDFDRSERSVKELDPKGAGGVTFGTLFPLGGSLGRNRVALGLGLHMPTRSLLNGQAIDPAVPHWYVYQALPSRIIAMLGLGILPVDWLSIGFGGQLLAGVEGALDYELDVVAAQFSRKSVFFDIQPVAAPSFGIEVRPLEGLRVGLVYRGAMQSTIDLPVHLDVTGIAILSVTTQFTVQYTPHQFALGASYTSQDLGLSLAGDVTWALWKRAPDPAVDSTLDVGGDVFEGAGLGDVLDAPAAGQERRANLRFRNIAIPRLGVEQAMGPVALRAGYSVRPSPLPLQASGTNYVDATSHQLSIGAGLRFRDPLGLFQNPLVFDLGGAVFIIPSRRYTKFDAQDPVGSYSASGLVLVGGIALRYEFKEAPTP